MTSVLYDRPSFPAQLDMSHPLTKELVGCWLLNETDALNMRVWDSSPYGHHGTTTAYPIRSGDGILFNGTTQYVTVPSNGHLNPNTITVEVWVKPHEVPSAWRDVVNKFWDGTSRNYTISMTNTNLWYWDCAYVGDNTDHIVNGPSVVNHRLYHLVGTYDGATQRFYVDGTEVGTPISITGGLLKNNTPLAFAVDARATPTGYLNCTIKLVRIWGNRALRAQDIKELYAHPYAMFLR